MLDNSRYTQWNDHEHERPTLSTGTGIWLADWAWLIIPIIIFAIVYLWH